MSRLIMRKTLVMRRTHTRTPRPTRITIRADTRRLSWLDEENGEQEMFRDGRDGQRNERAPLLSAGTFDDHDEQDMVAGDECDDRRLTATNVECGRRSSRCAQSRRSSCQLAPG